MNHLVVLDAQARELEKILSGVKTMLVKEFDPAHPVSPGDSLYFVRGKGDCALRVQATVVRVLFLTSNLEQGLAQPLKEMQFKLQFTEHQFDYWSVKKQILLVEFDSAQKMDVIQVAPEKTSDRSDWIAFEDLSVITA